MIRTRVISILVATGILLASPFVAAVAAGDDKPPNVILMMADDLGYGDLSCYGSPSIKTPVLDKLASEGVRLTSYYAGCTVCTPSRMALLTGAYPARLGWRGGVIGYRIKPVNGLAPEAVTIAEVFKTAGYATALCGKWHVGDAPAMLPMSQGFETAFYITKSNNQTKKLYRDGKLVADPFDNRLLTEQFVAAAIQFINASRDKPFFLYIPFTAPHFPAQAHPNWKGKSKLGAYGDVVEELDSRVGQILQTLKDRGLDQKTIVVFTSDNGPEPGQRNWARATPFRGLKWSALEGGNRVPCVVRYPAKIPPRSVSDEIVSAIDMLPTLARACGINAAKHIADGPKVDGVDVWDTLIGKSQNGHARNDLLVWHGWGTPQAIRVGQWKLYFDKVKEVAGSDKGPVLINLNKDPTERTNVAAKFPQRVRSMRQLADRRLADIKAHSIPLGGPAANRKPKN